MDKLTKREKTIISMIVRHELTNCMQNGDLSFKKENELIVIEKEHIKELESIIKKLETI